VVHFFLSWPPPEGTKHWHHSELHGAVVAMEAVSLTTGKVVRLPPLQHKLEALSCTLRGIC